MNSGGISKTCAEHPGRAAAAFCVKCGSPVCLECMTEVNARPHCPTCGSLAKAARPKAVRLPVPDFSMVAGAIQSRFIGPLRNKELRRAVALAIDLLCVFALSLPLSFFIRFFGMQFLVPEVAGFGFFFSAYISMVMVGSVYFTVVVWRAGGGPGKRLVGLKVRRCGGGGLTLAASAWRLVGMLTAAIWALFGWWLCGKIFALTDLAAARMSLLHVLFFKGFGMSVLLIFSSGILITFIGKNKRGFHDILASSIVVSE